MSPDRRLTPANGRVAAASLKGQVAAERYVPGERARIITPLADLLAHPDGPRDRQLLMGDDILILERAERHAFVQAQKDGYCGYVALERIGPDLQASHWVAAPATHLYATPTIKRRELTSLSFGARLTITGHDGPFAITHDRLFVPQTHLRPLHHPLNDPAAVAELFLGTPYLWGGNSRGGIDCSGLVQAACLACAIACPGDSDLQWQSLGHPLPADTSPQRGDLFFWKGHVAMALDAVTLIHANAHHMAVAIEPIQSAQDRICAALGPYGYLGQKRLA